MFALALPDGRMYSVKTFTGLTLEPHHAARWPTVERAALACDKANKQRTRLEPPFELVALYAEADVEGTCAA